MSLYELARLLAALMEAFKPITFFNVGKLIESISSEYGAGWLIGTGFRKFKKDDPARDEPMSEADCNRLTTVLAAISNECVAINLDRSTVYADDIIKQLGESTRPTYYEVACLLRELEKHIRWDMEKELFTYIPPERADYYHNLDLLSKEATNNFQSAAEEISLCGDCYAAGCWTASVMHAMRALEKPIHAVADAIGGINLPKGIELATWGEIHREINNQVIKLRGAAHTAIRDEDIAFYSNLNLEFGYFNDIWRRFAAHSRHTYDLDQAKSAMNHVIAFIDIAAQHGLKELP